MYKPINGWTKKEIIRAIKRGNKGAKSNLKRYLGDTMRVYRGEDGYKCAVGIFIPDDVYHDSCEGEVVGKLLIDFPGLATFMPLPTSALDQMQNIHDTCSDHDPRPELIEWIEENVE